MKLAPDEGKQLMRTMNLTSGNLRQRTLRKEDKYKLRATLRDIIEGKAVTIIMAIVTIFALVGVSLIPFFN